MHMHAHVMQTIIQAEIHLLYVTTGRSVYHLGHIIDSPKGRRGLATLQELKIECLMLLLRCVQAVMYGLDSTWVAKYSTSCFHV